ncbi:hypothetical protein O6R08_00695 [Cutibacterium equinum]|uniref:Uncharacterized protein n=1 Tax=Cutibacterium equinum TaxID=3016342 RepID=A0ABY7R2K8_9ACTN|nr:hypothetical protein [Cutibacterium equinum]WCC80958.1 hypothetical protein O6R08_00695 [Cutibacterium equinum]
MDLAALGTTVQVDVSETGLDEQVLRHAWARCLSDPDPQPTVLTPGPMTASSLTQEITRKLISRQIGSLLMFHAGAVCHPVTGDSVVFIAPGRTGKTTLATHLGRRYGYITDETVAIEPGTWRIFPYPKPLSTRRPDLVGEKAELSPDDLGLQPCHPEPHVSHLVLLARDDSHETLITPERRLDAMVTMAEQSSSVHKLPKPLHTLADLIDHVGQVWTARYAECQTLEPFIDDALGAPC